VACENSSLAPVPSRRGISRHGHGGHDPPCPRLYLTIGLATPYANTPTDATASTYQTTFSHGTKCQKTERVSVAANNSATALPRIAG